MLEPSYCDHLLEQKGKVFQVISIGKGHKMMLCYECSELLYAQMVHEVLHEVARFISKELAKTTSLRTERRGDA